MGEGGLWLVLSNMVVCVGENSLLKNREVKYLKASDTGPGVWPHQWQHLLVTVANHRATQDIYLLINKHNFEFSHVVHMMTKKIYAFNIILFSILGSTVVPRRSTSFQCSLPGNPAIQPES